MNLELLPPEILSTILLHLPQESIFILSKVSKLLKSICYTNLYTKIYIIISTDCRLYEFITTQRLRFGKTVTIISGLLQLSKFIVHTLLVLKKFIKKLYIDFLSFDNLLDPRIHEMFDMGGWITKTLLVKSHWTQYDTLEALFSKHVSLRLNCLDGWDNKYFDNRKPLKPEIKLKEITYTAPISYGMLISDINDVIFLCEETLNVIDYRIYYGWELKVHKRNRIVRVYQLLIS